VISNTTPPFITHTKTTPQRGNSASFGYGSGSRSGSSPHFPRSPDVVPYPDPHRLTAMLRGVVPNEQPPRASQRPLLRIEVRDRLFDQPLRLIRFRPGMQGGNRLCRPQCGGQGSVFGVREWTHKVRCSPSTQDNAFPITSSDVARTNLATCHCCQRTSASAGK